MALLRERGWLVHGTSRAEKALSILAHIPCDLIVLDSELPGMCGIALDPYPAELERMASDSRRRDHEF